MKKIFLDSLPLEKALEIFFFKLDELNIHHTILEDIKVINSSGRISAEAVFAKYSSPFYHSSAMDGYAVRFVDTFGATETTPLLLKLGKDALPIDTGDPMPESFNAVIMIEDINKVNDSIEIYSSVSPYQNVRIIGEDIVATELIIPLNHKIRPIDIGAMLASGQLDIKVRKKPLIAVIPTGSEIIEPELIRERVPTPPEIIEYNSAMLCGLANELGAETKRYNIVRDNLDDLKNIIKESCKDSDVVLIIAGSGRGSEDFTLQAIKDLGDVIINGVAIKPGKPVISGFIDNKPVIGIPGYPVSAYLIFKIFVKPLIYRLLGIEQKKKETVSATISRQLPSQMGIDEFVRVKVGSISDKYIATSTGRGAGLLMSLVRADGIVKIPASSEGLETDSKIEVELLRSREDIKNTIVCIGSHDNTIDILANILKKNYPRFSISSANVGSMAGLMALKKNETHIAGTHLLDEQSGLYNVPFIKKLLPDKKIRLINLVYRQQGLLIKKGNPKGIKGFEDLTRDDITFINRQAGSGTRLLLDKRLKDCSINHSSVKGYKKEEYTHMSVASAVLTGIADTGLAVYSSAKALDLDFIPIMEERYDLAIPEEFMDNEEVRAILDILINNTEFKQIVKSLGGYDIRDMGKRIY